MKYFRHKITKKITIVHNGLCGDSDANYPYYIKVNHKHKYLGIKKISRWYNEMKVCCKIKKLGRVAQLVRAPS